MAIYSGDLRFPYYAEVSEIRRRPHRDTPFLRPGGRLHLCPDHSLADRLVHSSHAPRPGGLRLASRRRRVQGNPQIYFVAP